MIEFIEHTLGICGDSHFSILTIFVEMPNIGFTFNYIKTLFKQNMEETTNEMY